MVRAPRSRGSGALPPPRRRGDLAGCSAPRTPSPWVFSFYYLFLFHWELNERFAPSERTARVAPRPPHLAPSGRSIANATPSVPRPASRPHRCPGPRSPDALTDGAGSGRRCGGGRWSRGVPPGCWGRRDGASLRARPHRSRRSSVRAPAPPARPALQTAAAPRRPRARAAREHARGRRGREGKGERAEGAAPRCGVGATGRGPASRGAASGTLAGQRWYQRYEHLLSHRPTRVHEVCPTDGVKWPFKSLQPSRPQPSGCSR